MDFSKLIAQGYTAVDILQSLFKKQPQNLNKVKKLIAYGYAAPTILRHLSGDKKRSDEDYMTSEERTFSSDESRRNETTKVVGAGLAAGLGGVGLLARGGQAAQTAGNVAAGQVGDGFTGTTIDATPIPPGGGGADQALKQAASTAVPPSQAVRLPNAVGPAGGAPPFPTPEGFPPAHSQEQSELFEKFDKLPSAQSEAPSINLGESKIEQDFPHLASTAERYLNSGKTPEEAYDLLNKSKMLSPLVKRYEAMEGKSYLDAMKGQHAIDSTPPEASVMMTPDGQVGDIFHVKDNTAILENDGKRFKADAETLQPIPKEWENLNIDLSQVPESDRSAPLSFVAPTEDKKELVVKFWTKEHKPVVYIYRRKDGQPFDEETLHSISNEVDAPITNGMKFSGAWAQTGKSRGSAFFHKMNRMSQDANKENDVSLPYIFVRAPFSFEHGFHKAVNTQFAKAEERFNEIYNPKKRRK